MADVAIAILTKDSRTNAGATHIDVDVLRAAGITDLSGYGGGPDMEYDLFVDPPAGV